MDIITINEQIFENIKLLRQTRDTLRLRAQDKAQANGEYDKQIAITLLKLRNGEPVTFEGEEVINPPVSIMDKIAKGICYKESIAKDVAESNYKNASLGLQAIQSIINALQSVLRFTKYGDDGEWIKI